MRKEKRKRDKGRRERRGGKVRPGEREMEEEKGRDRRREKKWGE